MPEEKKLDSLADQKEGKKRPVGGDWAEQTGKNPDDLEFVPESQDL
ncbi:MAG: hypothetical protein QHH75_08765 [Bacillota bacterium]|nr:hypothetical protein [Bacillota bacterium]